MKHTKNRIPHLSSDDVNALLVALPLVSISDPGSLEQYHRNQIAVESVTSKFLNNRSVFTADEIRVIGNFNSESKFVNAATGIETSVLLTSGRGYFIVGLLAVGQEPTNHALRDIAAKASEFESWGRSMILLVPDEKSYERYMAEPIAGLPSTVTFGIFALFIPGKVKKWKAKHTRLAEGYELC